MPKAMLEAYLACDKPPPLDKLNPYRYVPILGVKVRNMKIDFNTGGTWRRVGQ